MSTTGIDGYSIPEPAAYTVSGDLPAGLTTPIGSSATSSTSDSTTATATTAAPAVSPYVTAFAALQQYDAEELIQVSFSSQTAALSNVSDVLAQAAAYQEQQQAAQQQAAEVAANTPTNVPDVSVPSLGDIIYQSDQTANTAIQNYINAGSGASILDYQA